MADFTTESPSSRSGQLGKKWKVSPEFEEALLDAMRQRSNTGGPLPRLPSMLQLPSPEIPATPTMCSPTKPDSADRLKMKTRVAIRDQNPHRFQVVPLRDVNNYTPDQKYFRARQPLELTALKGLGISRANFHSGKKARVNENESLDCSFSSIKLGTPGRTTVLTERNNNLCSRSSQLPFSFDNHATLISEARLDNKSPLVTTKQPKPKQCSGASTRSPTPNRNTLHFKSPSLGNLRTKPNLDIDLEAHPVPRVTKCRKRTNTLSADHTRRPDRITSSEPQLSHEGSMDDKTSLVKRHAIYTQSLYVPINARSKCKSPNTNPSTQHSDDLSPLQTFPSRSSIPIELDKREGVPTHSALGIFASRPPGLQDTSSNSFSSVASMYSQAEEFTRPLTICALPSQFDSGQETKFADNAVPLQHHPIILKLLAEVDEAIQEWSST
ncbi:hypothetical protein H0H92_015561 [Tricholoma furcatifolium]|nr:hypothetical protein H0H92_015561 [Tricholoma furcatifolium]